MDWDFILAVSLIAGIADYLSRRLDLKGAIEQLKRELGE